MSTRRANVNKFKLTGGAEARLRRRLRPDNLDAAVPIGTTCRLCERLDCEQRAFPALQHGMTIDENVRGRSFFAPADLPVAATVPRVPIAKKRRR